MPESKKPHVCTWWHAYSFDNPLRGLVHNPDKIFGHLVQPGQTALDLGCGMGFFSLVLARMVGPSGKVISVDLQPQMLKVLQRRARRRGLLDRIRLQQCQEDNLGLTEPVDFALAFYMLHETPDQSAFLTELIPWLKPQAHFLLVEPKGHVNADQFQDALILVQSRGLKLVSRPQIKMSHAGLFVQQ